jgi:nitrite reductase (NADH) small subunit
MTELDICAWHGVCRVDDIPVQGARVVQRTGAEDIALFRNRDDRVFAVVDRCPHKGGPLSAGLVHGNSVSCPLHNWVIDLDSGQAQAPDQGCVKTVALKVSEGMVFLALDEGQA